MSQEIPDLYFLSHLQGLGASSVLSDATEHHTTTHGCILKMPNTIRSNLLNKIPGNQLSRAGS